MELLQKFYKSHVRQALCLIWGTIMVFTLHPTQSRLQLLLNSLSRIKDQAGDQNLQQEMWLLCLVVIILMCCLSGNLVLGEYYLKLFLAVIHVYLDPSNSDGYFLFGIDFLSVLPTFKELLDPTYRVFFLLRSCFLGEWREKANKPLVICYVLGSRTVRRKTANLMFYFSIFWD